MEVSLAFFGSLKSTLILGKSVLIVLISGLVSHLKLCKTFPCGAIVSCVVDVMCIEVPLIQET